jgi:chemotaxis protein methyltransferase CheR
MNITIDHEISDEDMRALCRELKNRYNADFTSYEPKSFKRRLVRAFKKFDLHTVNELWQKLAKAPDFIYHFVDEITVGLTSMFRDPELWLTLRELFIREISARQEIKIWHAGCSTGEEVATLAILLEEIGMLNRCKRLATDLNKSSVAFSEAACYPVHNWEEYQKNYSKYRPTGLLSDCFDVLEDDYILKDKYRINCSFSRHNLISDTYRQEKYDIIFCRNVMIYFENDLKKELLNKFYKSLKPNGFLVVGFLDNMLPIMNSGEFKMYDPAAKIFAVCE